jgi:hypothetical protein
VTDAWSGKVVKRELKLGVGSDGDASDKEILMRAVESVGVLFGLYFLEDMPCLCDKPEGCREADIRELDRWD